MKSFLTAFVFCLFISNVSAQNASDSFLPGYTTVEFKIAGTNLTNQYDGDGKEVDGGRALGLGAAFNTNIFVNPKIGHKFTHADDIGVGFALGAGKSGLWLNGTMRLGWQFHYAVSENLDFAFHTFGLLMYDKMRYTGIMFQPVVRIGPAYVNYIGGIHIAGTGVQRKAYNELNLRILFKEKNNETDRWFLGMRFLNVSGKNKDINEDKIYEKQLHFCGGLMF